jgi:hypothetical protein
LGYVNGVQIRAVSSLRRCLVLGGLLTACAEGAPGGGAPADASSDPDGASLPDAAVIDAMPGAADAADAAVPDATPGAPDAAPVPDAGAPDARPPAATYEFQDGVKPTAAYAGTTDAEILARTPSVNAGNSTIARMDGDDEGGQFDQHTVLRWDISSVPAGSRVRRVILALTATDGTGLIDPYFVFALRRQWEESAVTWERPTSTQLWQRGGGGGAQDSDNTRLGTFRPVFTGPFTIELNADGIDVVQRWVDDPSTNFGFLFANDDNGDGMEIATSEAATASARPRLIIETQ